VASPPIAAPTPVPVAVFSAVVHPVSMSPATTGAMIHFMCLSSSL
jgi:hypothetical protein